MAKLPYMQFYPADYQADVRCLSLAAQGAWMNILCTLWRSPKRGYRTLSLEGWANEIGRPSSEIKLLLIEMDNCGICDMNRENDEQITIKSRRMLRDERVRRLAAARQQKQRDKSESRTESRDHHSDVTGIYQKSEIRNQKSYSEEEKKTPIVPCKGTDWFEMFWSLYPRKVGKKAARRAWEKAKDRPPVADLVRALSLQKDSEQWQKENGQFIPHPATWLNQGRWADQLPPKHKSLMEEFIERGRHANGSRAILQGLADAHFAAVGETVSRSWECDDRTTDDIPDPARAVL